MVDLPQLKPATQILDSSWNSNSPQQQRSSYEGGKKTPEI